MSARSTTLTALLGAAAIAVLTAVGGAAPAGATPTPAPGASSTASASPTPTASTGPSPTPTASPIGSPAPSPTGAPTDAPTDSATPTPTPTPTVPPPTAVSMNRHSGHVSRSRGAVLTGTGFTNLAQVLVGGTPVPDLVVLSPTTARFTIPNAIDYQARTAIVSLRAVSDGVARPSAVTFRYFVSDAIDKQMSYAFRNWNAYSNARFGYLSGNDCANFTSQTLLARGWKQSSAWYDRGVGRWSATWVSSTALSRWLVSRPDLAVHLDPKHSAQVVVGDVVQFRWPGHSKKYTSWDHTAVVSKVVVMPDGHHDVYYVAHTNNRQYGGSTDFLTAYYAKQKIKGSALRIQFFHLKH